MKRNFLKYYLLISVLFVFATSYAEISEDYTVSVEEQLPDKKGFDVNRLIFGGTFGLQFGNYTVINISPQVGYAVTNNFQAGVGISYNYYNYSYYNESVNYLGLNLYAQYRLFRYINLGVQPEVYRVWGRTEGNKIAGRTVPVLLVGAGVFIPIGARSGLNLMFYYDLLRDKWSPYDNRIFYTIGVGIAI